MNHKKSACLKPLNSKGAIAMETVALGLLILAGYFGDVYMSRFGEAWGVAGIILGPVLVIIIIHSIAWLERQLFIGQTPLPKCKCGSKNIEELKDAADALPYVAGKGKKVCTCGTYIIGRGIIQHKMGNSEPQTYATWSKGKWDINN